MKFSAKLFLFLPLILLPIAFQHMPTVEAGGPPTGQDTLLKAANITPKLFPEHVFFRGQVASAQLRNTGDVHFADDLYVLAGLVDSSGYSTAIKEKYQGYFAQRGESGNRRANFEARRLRFRFCGRKIHADGSCRQ